MATTNPRPTLDFSAKTGFREPFPGSSLPVSIWVVAVRVDGEEVPVDAGE